MGLGSWWKNQKAAVASVVDDASGGIDDMVADKVVEQLADEPNPSTDRIRDEVVSTFAAMGASPQASVIDNVTAKAAASLEASR